MFTFWLQIKQKIRSIGDRQLELVWVTRLTNLRILSRVPGKTYSIFLKVNLKIRSFRNPIEAINVETQKIKDVKEIENLTDLWIRSETKDNNVIQTWVQFE